MDALVEVPERDAELGGQLDERGTDGLPQVDVLVGVEMRRIAPDEETAKRPRPVGSRSPKPVSSMTTGRPLAR